MATELTDHEWHWQEGGQDSRERCSTVSLIKEAPKEHLVNQAHQMLMDGDSLAKVKLLIGNLAVPPPPTPEQQLADDTHHEWGSNLFIKSGAYLW